MPDNVISLSSRRALQDNRAREALIEILRERQVIRPEDDASLYADLILASLWSHGYKVVVIDKKE